MLCMASQDCEIESRTDKVEGVLALVCIFKLGVEIPELRNVLRGVLEASQEPPKL